MVDIDPPGGSDASGPSAAEDDSMYGWRVRSIRRALAERGLSEGKLTVDDLTALGHLDQYHYFGTTACDEAARVLDLDDPETAQDRRVLDVGSGVGGPARYLAATTGCAVHGVELRQDLVAMARELTARATLDDRVRYTAGDVTDLPVAPDGALTPDAYDHVVAWLVLLHLPDRAPALDRMRRAVRPGGTVLVEDFALADATPAQQRALREVVDAPNLVDREALLEEFRSAFVDVASCDLTEAWTAWTEARFERFRERRASFAAVHGEETYESRASFYRTVRDLFADGAIHGLRITARVPADGTDRDPLPLRDRCRSDLVERDLHGILEGGAAD